MLNWTVPLGRAGKLASRSHNELWQAPLPELEGGSVQLKISREPIMEMTKLPMHRSNATVLDSIMRDRFDVFSNDLDCYWIDLSPCGRGER